MKNRFFNYVKEYGANSVVFRNFSKILLTFLLATAIPVSAAYILFVNSVKKDSITNGRLETQKASIIAENSFRDMEYLAANILSDSNTKLFFSDKGTSLYDTYAKSMTDSLLLYSKVNLNLKAVYVYHAYTHKLYNFEGEVDDAKKSELNWSAACESMVSDYKIELQRSKSGKVISYVFLKRDAASGGIVIAETDVNTVTKTLKDISDIETDVYIMCGDEVIYQTSAEVPKELFTLENEEEYVSGNTFYSLRISQYYDLKYAVAINMSGYSAQLNNAYHMLIILILSLFLFTLIIAVILSKDNVSYIIWLTELLDKNKKPVNLKDNEIKYITERVIGIISDNEKLKKEVESRMSQYDSISIKALSAQISPHFLNNSLNAVNYQLKKECGYGSQASSMLCKLSKLIGYSYITDEILVDMQSEFDFIADYIEFLKIRYGDFESEIILPPSLENARIMKMCLQPFVENSVFHGFSKEKNKIKIECFSSENSVFISVYDNGMGMKNEKIQQILKEVQNGEFSDENIGMKNVFRRLKLVYGNKIDIDINSEYGEYTKIILEIKK